MQKPLFDVVYEGTWFTVNRLPREGKRKTDNYEVLTRQCDVIGHIAWYGPWRKYSYFPEPETVMEAQCMQEIAVFLRTITIARARTTAHILLAVLWALAVLAP